MALEEKPSYISEHQEHDTSFDATSHVEKHEHYDDDSSQQLTWGWKKIIATASLCGIWTGAQIPLFFIGGALSYVVTDLGSPSVSSWLTVSYTLAIGAVAPFCGYLADLLGQRNVVLFGEALVLIGLIIVGTAQGFSQACGGMGIIGGGAAITELTALAGIASIVPVKKRGTYLAICTAFLFPFTPYVLYGQLIATRSTWRWTIWLCLIYNAIFGVGIVATFFPESNTAKKISTREVLRRIDYVGALLSIGGISLFLVALGSGGYTHSWDSAYVLATLLVGIVLILAFVVWEWKGAKYPMVPSQLFSNNTIVWRAFVTAFIAGMNLYSLLNFFPLTFSTVFNPDPVQVGLKGLGYGISVTAGAVTVNALLSVLKGHNRELLIFSTVVMTAFGGALAAVTPNTPRMAVALGTIAGFGVGGVYIPAATIALTATPDELLATTGALSLSVRTIGGSIGYTIYFNVFSTRLAKRLPTALAAAAAGAGLPTESLETFVKTFVASPAMAAEIPGVTQQIIAAAASASQWSYAYALSYVWYVSIAFGVLSVVASIFLGNVTKYMTNRIAAQIK
ncbi:hypothetical protein M409DRAFT_55818 [Zasmidium cellare ATCC 36951]|uniref:Major facilitator superfamily (MFS) profile domain-containing protein n=1 Tax=Zasmidium cellare ATCC 36951 TaxID=1080233 RepID=A0A6A6CGV5_ZASCE|nr:uncharacterized protein M409DRAFT_55818 [Zasmidium cellare ATCC 36951]KAF2165420.1 hypothetical protein M409DRAFT_55818 [Zasmidium cellare ATCC 36951]